MKIKIIYSRFGGGIETAAKSIKAAINEKKSDWEVSLLNLGTISSKGNFFSLASRVYNRLPSEFWSRMARFGLIRSSLTWLCGHFQSPEGGLTDLFNILSNEHPDLVISLIPTDCGGIKQVLHRVDASIPLVTLSTHLTLNGICPWLFQSDSDYYMVGSEYLVDEALKSNIPREKIALLSGVPIHPQFAEKDTRDKRVAKEQFGLDPDLPLILLQFGRNGRGQVRRLLRSIKKEKKAYQFVIFGADTEGRKHYGTHKLYFVTKTNRVKEYLALSDLMIGKPGAMAVSEAIAMKVPILLRDYLSMSHETEVLRCAKKAHAGATFSDFHEIPQILNDLFACEQINEMKGAISSSINRSSFQAVEFIEKLTNSSK